MASKRIFRFAFGFLVTALLSGYVNAESTTGPTDPCETAVCDGNQYCYNIDGVSYTCIDEGYRPGHCSQNKYTSCDQYAECIEAADGESFTCVCPPTAQGDGFKPEIQGTGCQLAFKPCSDNSDCPQHGYCDRVEYKCFCNPGFEGDGYNCTDINECPSPQCHEHAICKNIPGSFVCTCDSENNYVGDGFTCALFCLNDNQCDAPRARCNENNTCECVEGYEGDGIACSDVDECQEGVDNDCDGHATCQNTVGTYECQCNNGYSGDGFSCTALPKDCRDINFVRGNTYTIDPDGEGPGNAFKVICDKIRGVTVTKVYPVGTFPLATPDNKDTPLDVEYEPQPDDIKPLLENSLYCYQDISFVCMAGFSLFPGTTWYDAYGNPHQNWGSTKDQQCACGELGQCSSCNCDGSQSGSTTTDSGRIVDKSRLPVVRIEFSQDNPDKGRVDISELICSHEQVDVPKDCHEAKFVYDIKKNQPLYIDVDGQGGQDPFLVYCDMESYKHVGITEVPPNQPEIVPTTIEGTPVQYPSDLPRIEALIQGSVYCSQKVEFECQESRLAGGGGYVSVTSADRKLDYFPGANGVQDSCGCGATQSCDAPEVKCNCDIGDDKKRKDFGLIINKSDMPVVRVTAEIGDNKSGTYTVGSLRCSQKQFGIEPNCEKYRGTGETEDYTYFADPDGPGGVDPFLVECQFMENPPQGTTIVHHEDEEPKTIVDASWFIHYLQANMEQIDALKDRSTFCTQEVKIGCKQFNVQVPSGTVNWVNAALESQNLKDQLESCNADGSQCACNGAGEAVDSATITDMDSLPAQNLDFSAALSQLSGGAELTVTLGPLKCSEVFETCALLKNFIDSGAAVEGEAAVVDGFFTIDPDGPGGADPFMVECRFPATIVIVGPPSDGISPDPNNPDTPVSQCYEISYSTESGSPISPAQISALVEKSGKCKQDLTLNCQNAPASGKVNFTTCDGTPQKGWAASYGADSCACGVNGNCDGGPNEKCNCDMADGKVREDSGSIIETDRLPVCEICLTIDPPSSGDGSPAPPSMLKYTLGELKCDGGLGTKDSCQTKRREDLYRAKEPMEVSVSISHDPPILVGCRYVLTPPVGILVVKPKEPVIPDDGESPIDVNIVYITINITLIRQTLVANEYCSQKVFLFCATDETVQLGGNYGWYNFDGQIFYDWTPLPDEDKDMVEACEANPDLCQSCGMPKGFQLTKKEDLPVARLLLAGSGVTVYIGEVQCVDLGKSCQHILDGKFRWQGYQVGKQYAIDPDGPGPIEPFTVNCEMDKPNGNGVTEVPTKGQWVGKVEVKDQTGPAQFYLPIEYDGATSKQIDALTDVSEFCWQGVKYECSASPLLNHSDPVDSYYTLYNGGQSHSFGTGADTSFAGCACGLTGTCLPGFTCNCDAMKRMGVDQGAVTDKDAIPMTGFYVGGQVPDVSLAQIQVTGVRCSSKPLDIPKDCAEAKALKSRFGVDYSYSSEYLIAPSLDVEPFMVRCDFEISPGNGVTIVKSTFPDKTPVPKNPAQPTDIKYQGPTEEQVRELVKESAYCYQGVRYDCYSSTLLSEGSYWLTEGSREKRQYWGGGHPTDDSRHGVCACGAQQSCGGLDSAAGQRNRRCNCDVGDNVTRSDAGILNIKDHLPISEFWQGRYAQFENVNMTVGILYCSQVPLKFNECEMGFSDCHPMARCIDEDEGYRCVCRDGWNGKGVVLASRYARANGRECIDDDECVANKPCPYSATCTNTPGDFYCTCKPGYEQVSKVQCKDINECSDPALNDCDENARCENLDGSYRCKCRRGYRGDGRTCVPVGQCSCFGDPHCISYDNKWLHFQGLCEYVMTQDGCKPGQSPTFTVIVNHWQQESHIAGSFSWIKSVRVQVLGKEITLEQEGRILVDGVAVRQYNDEHRISVVIVNQRVKLQTVIGLEVLWDGDDTIEVVVPNGSTGSTCGLCGDYDGNPDNDWTQGPACPADEGQITDNQVKFGNSWALQTVDCVVDCNPPVEEPEEECVYPMAVVEAECDKLMNINTSPFRACLHLKSQEDLDQFRVSCIFDVCHSEGGLESEVCEFAETISKDCGDNEKVELKNWKQNVDACEEPTCENNMIFLECGPTFQPTCVSDNVNRTVDEEVCNEGCFCPQNMVMEGEKCIERKQCGCFYDNSYMEKGDVILLPDCSYKIECFGQNMTSETPVECGENEECRLEDGVVDCYCKEMYVMNANGQCEPDNCYDVVCDTPNMECLNGTCICKMGFIGDCNQCEDIDECATGTHDCNKIGQKCVNTPGSFKCLCEDGFIKNGQRCADIDECAYGMDDCGENAECVNSLGSHRCECCAGYKKDPSGDCIRDTSTSTASQCCACQGEKCLEPGKVCGTDGKTYANYRALAVSGCKKGDDELKVNYPGPCQGTCDSVVCDKQFATCEKNADGVPTCECPSCEDGSSTFESETVCASNKVTYTSVCHMQKATCEAEIETTVEVVVEGRPCPGNGDPIVGPWSDWGDCSEECKQGVRNRTRKVLIDDASSSVHTEEYIPCFGTCPEGPCTQETCTGAGQVCTADENDVPSCDCPVCEDFYEDPVCGRVGLVIQTYESECKLMAEVCQTGEPDYEILEPRACEEKPVDCGLIRKYIIEKDANNCEADRSINMGECYGGCDEEAELCCYGNQKEEKMVSMLCPDGSQYDKPLEVITGCDCIERSEIGEPEMVMEK